MKKILFPALAAMMFAAAPTAFAQTSGGWFVLTNSNTHSCFVANRTATPGEETLSGPFVNRTEADTVMGDLVQCGDQWQP